jgi:hypothetical protein
MEPNWFLFTLLGVSTVSLTLAPDRALSERLVGIATCPEQTETSATHTRSVIERRLQREIEILPIPLDGRKWIGIMTTPLGIRH